MKKNGFLDSIRVGSPCEQDWAEMQGSDKVRFCDHCALEVNNLSALTRKEAMRVVRQSEGRICVRYIKNPETNAPVFAEKLYRITRRAGIAAGVLGASLTLSTLAYAQGGAEVSVSSNKTDATEKQAKKDKTESKTGTLSGTVTDPNGAMIPNMPLTLCDEKTGESRNTLTGEDGVYEFRDVPAGTYKIRSDARTGFAAYESAQIQVLENEIAKVDISLSAAVQSVMVMVGDIAVVEYEHTLSSAVSSENFEEVKDLIARGANVNARDKNYGATTALHIAVENGNREIAKYLLDMGARINARDKNRRTPLMSIDDDATPELVRMLLDHRAKVDAFDKEGNTALIFAAEYEDAEILRVLLDAGASVNTQNKEGKTALMVAAENGSADNVKTLLEAGADVNLRDKEGKTALDLSDDEEIQNLLKSYDAKEN